MAVTNGVKIPIVLQLDDKMLADGAVVRPITFNGFAECLNEAYNLKEPKSIEARLRRVRMIKQVTYYANGTPVPVSVYDVPNLTIISARAIQAHLDSDEGTAGKIIQTGDGIIKSIVYELGTPIPVQGKEPIRELEFSAKKFGDVEDIMSADNQFTQTVMLISTIAKPLGTTLMTLPSWASAQITMPDGYVIMREILPHFLGAPVES